MNGVGVAQAAARLGISQQRVRHLLESGRLPGQQVSGRWVIDPAGLNRPEVSAGRPMSSRMTWGLVELLEGDRPEGLAPSEVSRLRRKARVLASAVDPALVLRSWLPNRAVRVELVADASSIAELGEDERLVPSGVSDPRAGLSASHEVEGYVRRQDVAGLRRDHLLLPVDVAGQAANVVLHVVEHAVPAPAPWVLLLADLADRAGPRETARLEELLAQRFSQVSGGGLVPR
jgi:hypothetical protein